MQPEGITTCSHGVDGLKAEFIPVDVDDLEKLGVGLADPHVPGANLLVLFGATHGNHVHDSPLCFFGPSNIHQPRFAQHRLGIGKLVVRQPVPVVQCDRGAVDAGLFRILEHRLLPGLDPTVMGWKERDFYLDAGDVADLFDRFGNAGPTVWADGRVVGGWNQRPDGAIVVELTQDVTAEHQRLLADAVDELQAALDGVVVRPRFPAPVQKRIWAG